LILKLNVKFAVTSNARQKISPIMMLILKKQSKGAIHAPVLVQINCGNYGN